MADVVPAQARLSREQQKELTMEGIRSAALDLFERDGFEATTVDAIAAAAGIGRRTFFRYFPVKEAVLFGHVLLPGVLDSIDRSLAAGMSPLDATLSSLRDGVAYPEEPSAIDVRRRRLRAELLSHPAVSAYYRTHIAELARQVAAVVQRHPRHAAVPHLAELVGGLVQTVLIAHVDSGEVVHLQVHDASWRRAVSELLG